MRSPRPLSAATYRALAIGGVALMLFGPGAYDWLRLTLRQRQLDRQLTTLVAEHEQLTQEHVRLQTDPTYVEGLIRSTFKVAQPGELVVPLTPSPSAKQSSQ